MADETPQGPTLADLAGTVGQLAQTVGQLTAAQQRQMATLQQIAQGVQPKPTPPDAATLDRANEEYLKTFAHAPLAVREQEKRQIAMEVAQALRMEMQQNLSVAERQRRAEEMERSIYQQNPDLMAEGPHIEFYLNHLNQNPATAGWQIQEKIGQAIAWARENKAEREKQIIEQHERSKKEIARASLPGGGSFRDPGGREAEITASEEEANQKRFELIQGRKTAAMGGGRYVK